MMRPPRSDFLAASFLTQPPRPLPLWRFVVVAALLVGAIGSLLFARRGGLADLKISAKVSGTPTPTAQGPDAAAPAGHEAAFVGSGAWVMSSLPSCFQERERISGPLADLQSKFPPAADRVRPSSVVVAGECTIAVHDRDLLISRGSDRLRVPPDAFLYRNAAGLTLVDVHGTRAEIRRYERR